MNFSDLDFVKAVETAESASDGPVLAIELDDGRVVTISRTSVSLIDGMDALEDGDDDDAPSIDL